MKRTTRNALRLVGLSLALVGLVASSAPAGQQRPSRSTRQRLAQLAALQSARQAALTLIRDEARYVKSDQGKVIQVQVDEFTAKVERSYRKVQRQLMGDLKKLHRRSNREALQALVTAREDRLNAWEKALVRQLRDLQTVKSNDQMLKHLAKDKQLTPHQVEEIRLTNAYRMLMGEPALGIECKLVDAAAGHSTEMRKLGYFSHSSPTPGHGTPFARAEQAGFDGQAVGENIAMGYPSPQAVHRGWLRSPGHHRNILVPGWNCMGVARAGEYWTQVFGTTRPDGHTTAQSSKRRR